MTWEKGEKGMGPDGIVRFTHQYAMTSTGIRQQYWRRGGVCAAYDHACTYGTMNPPVIQGLKQPVLYRRVTNRIGLDSRTFMQYCCINILYHISCKQWIYVEIPDVWQLHQPGGRREIMKGTMGR